MARNCVIRYRSHAAPTEGGSGWLRRQKSVHFPATPTQLVWTGSTVSQAEADHHRTCCRAKELRRRVADSAGISGGGGGEADEMVLHRCSLFCGRFAPLLQPSLVLHKQCCGAAGRAVCEAARPAAHGFGRAGSVGHSAAMG